jgi:hypothetical protein
MIGPASGFFGYAETHYKFKLPWSPLHKPWPEIFFDLPFQFVPGARPRVHLFVKDGDLYPVTLSELEFQLRHPTGRLETWIEPPPQISDRKNLQTLPYSLPYSLLPGNYQLEILFTCRNRKGVLRKSRTHNYPGLSPWPLIFRILEETLPYPPGWSAGEMHCHSDFSSDPVEFGAPLAVLQEAGWQAGLNYVLVTDHSYDFYYRRDRYMQPTDPAENFAEYQQQAMTLNQANPQFATLIPGEEVSCGNGENENVHLLTFGHKDFLPGLGDGGRRWFNNKPDLRVAAVIEKLQGTPCFAAHPQARISWFEKRIFRRGRWNTDDVLNHPGLCGLQFWNGHRGTDFREGYALWLKSIQQGRPLLPIGANDAHGDLNLNRGVKTPLFNLYQSRRHVFGKVRTLVPCSNPTLNDLQSAFRGPIATATDGPFLSLIPESGKFRIHAAASQEMGGLKQVRCFQIDSRGEKRVQSWELEGRIDWEELWSLPGGMGTAPAKSEISGKAFWRVEAETVGGGLALSSPLPHP